MKRQAQSADVTLLNHTEKNQPASWSALLRGKYGIYAIVLAGGVILHAVNIYLTTTVMPSAVQDIGGLDLYAWTTTLFVLASIQGATLTTQLLNHYTPRAAYLIAVLIFGSGTLICSLAPNMIIMLSGRTLQGLGAGFLYALAYGLTRLVLPESLWSRVISLITAMFGIATLIGPAVGGLFAEYGLWRAAFWSLLPFAVLFALLAYTFLPAHFLSIGKETPLPLQQMLLLIAAVLTVSGGSLANSGLWSLIGLLLGLVLIGILIVVERKSTTRLLPRNTFQRALPLGTLYLGVALFMFTMQPETFVPYLLQHLHAQSPLWAGYLSALMAMGWTLSSIASARWQRNGSPTLPSGALLSLLGLFMLVIWMPHPTSGEWIALLPICIGLLLVGAGIGLAWPSLVIGIYQNAPQDEQDLATSGMTTLQLFAISLGAACAGMVANFAGISEPVSLAGATRTAFWLSLLFALAPIAALLTSLRILRLTRQ